MTDIILLHKTNGLLECVRHYIIILGLWQDKDSRLKGRLTDT